MAETEPWETVLLQLLFAVLTSRDTFSPDYIISVMMLVVV